MDGKNNTMLLSKNRAILEYNNQSKTYYLFVYEARQKNPKKTHTSNNKNDLRDYFFNTVKAKYNNKIDLIDNCFD